VSEKWFAKDLPDKIKLPGILQAHGYDITTNTPWVFVLVMRGGNYSRRTSPRVRPGLERRDNSGPKKP